MKSASWLYVSHYLFFSGVRENHAKLRKVKEDNLFAAAAVVSVLRL